MARRADKVLSMRAFNRDAGASSQRSRVAGSKERGVRRVEHRVNSRCAKLLRRSHGRYGRLSTYETPRL